MDGRSWRAQAQEHARLHQEPDRQGSDRGPAAGQRPRGCRHAQRRAGHAAQEGQVRDLVLLRHDDAPGDGLRLRGRRQGLGRQFQQAGAAGSGAGLRHRHHDQRHRGQGGGEPARQRRIPVPPDAMAASYRIVGGRRHRRADLHAAEDADRRGARDARQCRHIGGRSDRDRHQLRHAGRWRDGHEPAQDLVHERRRRTPERQRGVRPVQDRQRHCRTDAGRGTGDAAGRGVDVDSAHHAGPERADGARHLRRRPAAEQQRQPVAALDRLHLRRQRHRAGDAPILRISPARSRRAG